MGSSVGEVRGAHELGRKVLEEFAQGGEGAANNEQVRFEEAVIVLVMRVSGA